MYRWTLAALLLPSLAFGQARQPPSVLPGGDISGNTAKATGGTVTRSVVDRASSDLTVHDFGAKGDCTTDDTAAFNAYASYLRSKTGYSGYTTEFALGNGLCYALAGSVNLTALPYMILEGHNSVLVGKVSGYPVLDAVQSPQQTFQNFTLIGVGTGGTPPLVGIQIGRALNGLSGAQSTAFNNVFLDGVFSRAAIYNRASETSVFTNTFASNRQNSATAYSLIMDGSAFWQIVSNFAATYNPGAPGTADALFGTSPNMSFNENLVTGGSYLSYYGPAIWMSNFRGLTFDNPYVSGYYASLSGPGQGPAAVLYFGAADVPAHLTWRVHAEGGITSDIQFAGAQASPTLTGFIYDNHVDSTFGSSLSLGSGVASVALRDTRISVGSYFRGSTTLFDTGSAWSVYGSATLPASAWNGTGVSGLLDTGTGPTYSGGLGSVSATSLTVSTLNATTVANPGGVSSVVVGTHPNGVSLFTSVQLAGNLPVVTLTPSNGQGAGATAAFQNVVLNSPPGIAGGVGCTVGDTINLTDPQAGGGVYGGGQAFYTVTTVSAGAVTGTSWGSSANNAFLWAKPMSSGTALSARSTTCTTLPSITQAGGYPNSSWAIANNAASLNATLTFTAGSGYTATPNYAISPIPSTNVTSGAPLVISLSSALGVSAGNGAIALNSSGTVLGSANGSPVVVQTHLTRSGTAPALSSGATDCGTSPSIAGNDGAGRVTVGSSTNGGKCTITFASTWANAPICSVVDETTATALRPVVTTTTLALTGTLTAADKLSYACTGF